MQVTDLNLQLGSFHVCQILVIVKMVFCNVSLFFTEEVGIFLTHQELWNFSCSKNKQCEMAVVLETKKRAVQR